MQDESRAAAAVPSPPRDAALPLRLAVVLLIACTQVGATQLTSGSANDTLSVPRLRLGGCCRCCCCSLVPPVMPECSPWSLQSPALRSEHSTSTAIPFP